MCIMMGTRHCFQRMALTSTCNTRKSSFTHLIFHINQFLKQNLLQVLKNLYVC